MRESFVIVFFFWCFVLPVTCDFGCVACVLEYGQQGIRELEGQRGRVGGC